MKLNSSPDERERGRQEKVEKKGREK